MNKTEHNLTLTPKQDRVISALLDSANIGSAMRKAKVSRTTYYEWLRTDAAFRTTLKSRQSSLFEAGMTQLKALLSKAIIELGRLLESQDERIRLVACKQVLDNAFAAFEQQTLIERIEKLEGQTAKMEAR